MSVMCRCGRVTVGMKTQVCKMCKDEAEIMNRPPEEPLPTPELEDVLHQNLRMLAGQQARIESLMIRQPGYNATLASEATKLGRTLSLVTKELRAVQLHNKSLGENLTIEERISVMVEFVESLPLERQRSVAHAITRVVNDSRKAANE